MCFIKRLQFENESETQIFTTKFQPSALGLQRASKSMGLLQALLKAIGGGWLDMPFLPLWAQLSPLSGVLLFLPAEHMSSPLPEAAASPCKTS